MQWRRCRNDAIAGSQDINIRFEQHLRCLGQQLTKRGQIMGSHFWNKSIAISAALAAAGVLACAAALLNAFVPRGSLVAFLASTALLGLVATGVAIGYVWVCEKSEGYFEGRLDRLLSIGKPEGNASSPSTVVRTLQLKIKVPVKRSQAVGLNGTVTGAHV
jgi:hypothetical protein